MEGAPRCIRKTRTLLRVKGTHPRHHCSLIQRANNKGDFGTTKHQKLGMQIPCPGGAYVPYVRACDAYKPCSGQHVAPATRYALLSKYCVPAAVLHIQCLIQTSQQLWQVDTYPRLTCPESAQGRTGIQLRSSGIQPHQEDAEIIPILWKGELRMREL